MDEEPTLNDITSYERFYPVAPVNWIWWVCSALVLLGVVYFYVRLKRTQKAPQNLPPSLLEHSEAKVRALIEQRAVLPLSHLAAELSLILRDFLTQSYRTGALYQSQEQFAKAPPLLKVDPSLRQRTNALLHQLWEEEYSPSQPDPARAQDLLGRASALLRALPQPETATTIRSASHALTTS